MSLISVRVTDPVASSRSTANSKISILMRPLLPFDVMRWTPDQSTPSDHVLLPSDRVKVRPWGSMTYRSEISANPSCQLAAPAAFGLSIVGRGDSTQTSPMSRTRIPILPPSVLEAARESSPAGSPSPPGATDARGPDSADVLRPSAGARVGGPDRPGLPRRPRRGRAGAHPPPDLSKIVDLDARREVLVSMAENIERATPEQRRELVELARAGRHRGPGGRRGHLGAIGRRVPRVLGRGGVGALGNQ